jgi:hypothetical protein
LQCASVDHPITYALQAEYGAARDALLGALLQEAERLLRSGAPLSLLILICRK